LIKNALTDREFKKYFDSIEGMNSPTLEEYKNYIQTNPEFNNNEELRQQYLKLLLEDQEIIDKITEIISSLHGGKKRIKRRKTNRYIKSGKHKKTKKHNTKKHNIKKHKTKKHNIKKHKLCLN
jgi:uncharacterized protein (DUF1697 family)